MTAAFKGKAYLRRGCPYSFKFLLFMAEARLLDQIEISVCDPDAGECERVKAALSAKTDRRITFPIVEIEPGRYESDSNRLIEYYAARHNVAPEKLVALSFYKDGIFPQVEKLHTH